MGFPSDMKLFLTTKMQTISLANNLNVRNEQKYKAEYKIYLVHCHFPFGG